MTITTIDPKTALVVIDLQQAVMGIETQPLSPATVLERTVQIADAFRAHDLPVILVRTTGQPHGRTDLSHGADAETAYPEGWDTLDPRLTTGPHHTFTKAAWGPFSQPDSLHDLLRELEITQVVLTGIATSLGVESTARSAHEHGYHVTLITDAMGDRDAALHHSSIAHIFPRLGETGTTADLLEHLARRGLSS